MLRRLYIFSALDELMLIYPLYAVMFADRGLSTLSISVLLILWSVAGLIFEVPSGVLADKYDRRVILAAGEGIRAVGYLCWFVFPNFTGFLVGFILWGINGAFTSGTFEALTYDELKAKGKEASYTAVYGRCQGLGLIAVLSASALAAPVAHLGYTVPLLASVAVSLLAGITAITMPKASRSAEVTDSDYFVILRHGVSTALHSRPLLLAILFAAVAGSFYGSLEEYETLFANDVGIDNAGVALISAFFGLAAAAAAFLADRIAHLPRVVLDLLLGLAGVSMFVAAVLASGWGVPLLALFFFLSKLVSVVADANVQHAINDQSRATITSVSNFILEIAALSVYALFGFAAMHSRFTAFKVCGLTLVAIAAVFMLRSGMQRMSRASAQGDRATTD